MGIHFKQGYFNSLAWVYTLDKGEPVADAEVHLVGNDRSKISKKTNKDGFILLPGTKEKFWKRIIAKKGNDFTTMRMQDHIWDKGIRAWDYKIHFERLTSKYNFLAQTISDRPIYKPSDEVRLKVFTRKWDNKTLDFIKDYNHVEIKIRNNRGELVSKQNVDINSFGTGFLKFKLPSDAKTGDYKIQVTNKSKQVRSFEFKVEDYRLSTIKVSTNLIENKNKNLKLEAKACRFSAKVSYLNFSATMS